MKIPIIKKVRERIRYEMRLPSLTIELTDRCNLACSYCPNSIASIQKNSGNMDFDLFKKIINKINIEKIKFNNITLVGLGEPLLYKQLIEAIDYIKSNLPGTPVWITTNGILLNETIAVSLIQSKLDCLTVSINSSSREDYLRLNGTDHYDTVVENTLKFLELLGSSDSKMRFLIKILGEPANSKENINNFKEFWSNRLGKNGEIIEGQYIDWAGVINNETTRKIVHTKRDDDPYPCYMIGKEWIIKKEGICVPCCMTLVGETNLNIGNINGQSFREIFINGKIIKKIKRMNKTGDLFKLSPCDKCMTVAYSNLWFRNPLYRIFGDKWL